jgi:hypothetical protein
MVLSMIMHLSPFQILSLIRIFQDPKWNLLDFQITITELHVHKLHLARLQEQVRMAIMFGRNCTPQNWIQQGI